MQYFVSVVRERMLPHYKTDFLGADHEERFDKYGAMLLWVQQWFKTTGANRTSLPDQPAPKQYAVMASGWDLNWFRDSSYSEYTESRFLTQYVVDSNQKFRTEDSVQLCEVYQKNSIRLTLRCKITPTGIVSLNPNDLIRRGLLYMNGQMPDCIIPSDFRTFAKVFISEKLGERAILAVTDQRGGRDIDIWAGKRLIATFDGRSEAGVEDALGHIYRLGVTASSDFLHVSAVPSQWNDLWEILPAIPLR